MTALIVLDKVTLGSRLHPFIIQIPPPAFLFLFTVNSICTVNKSSRKIHEQPLERGSSGACNSTTGLEKIKVPIVNKCAHLYLLTSPTAKKRTVLFSLEINHFKSTCTLTLTSTLTLTAEHAGCHFASVHSLSRRSVGFIQTAHIPADTLFWGRKCETPNLAL